MVIAYATTPSKRPGYIDPTSPYAANHILVDDLGDDEILLIACDNGEVIGYRTDLIAHAFENGKDVNTSGRARILEPFFLQDVGASACEWS